MKTFSTWRAALVAFLILLISPVHAGQRCEPLAVDPLRTQRAMALAARLDDTLGSRPDRVAVIARVGSDVRRYGLRYTHAALVVRDTANAPWTVIHKLNTCGSDRSRLYRQGLGNFFLDDPYEYRVMVVWLKPAIATKLLDASRSEGRLREVDQPRYSLLAYPYATDYQNSNGWLLEWLAAVTAEPALRDRAAAQRRLRATHFDPDVIRVGAAERLGASVGRAEVSFLDHPLRHRLAGEYETVTVESLVRWLDRQGWIATQTELEG